METVGQEQLEQVVEADSRNGPGSRLHETIVKITKVVMALAVLVGAVTFLIKTINDGRDTVVEALGTGAASPSPSAVESPSVSSEPTTTPPTPTPTQASPAAAEPPPPPPSTATPLGPGEVRVTCERPPASAPQGTIFEIDYYYETDRAGTVGEGVGLYVQGTDTVDDRSTGYGDTPVLLLPMGKTTHTRSVKLDVPVGTYELVAEVWPSGKVGSDDEEHIASSDCGFIIVT